MQTQEHLWSEDYDQELHEVFAVQSDIAQRIAGALKAQLNAQEKQQIEKKTTENLEAYTLYLKGRYFWNKRTAEGFRKAMECFQQAIAKEPNYALAYAGLADCNLCCSPTKEKILQARAAAMKALEIDYTLAEAHTSLAMSKMWDWDFREAESEFKRAIELNPNYATAHHWYAGYLSDMGRHDEAFARIKLALELDPLSLPISREVGDIFLFARQYDRAIEQYRKNLEMDPAFALTHLSLGWAYVQKRMYEESIVEFQKYVQLSESKSRVWIGYAYAMQGKRVEAMKILSELKELSKQQEVSPFYFVIIYTALDEKDQAFAWLKKAYEYRAGRLVSLKVDPMLDSLRSDPRFTALLKKVGLEK